MNTIQIHINTIANGYVVQYGQHEGFSSTLSDPTFYPSYEEVVADLPNLARAALNMQLEDDDDGTPQGIFTFN